MNKFKKIIITFFIIIIFNLYYIQIIKNEFYLKKFDFESKKIITSGTAPRGRIYDKNGEILVDNIPKKIIYYKKEINTSKEEMLTSIKEVCKLIDIDVKKININIIKEYYMFLYDTSDLITKKEWEQYKTRKINDLEIYKLKIERIKNTENINKEEAMLYYLMNKGYNYEEKIIKENPTIYEYAIIAENLNKIKGFNIKLDFERIYPYETVFRTMLGNIGEFNKDNEKQLLKNGHNLNDLVGISYLEEQYDNYLIGEKNKYELYNNQYTLLEEGKRGNDIFLTIDIDLQMKIENILIEEIKNAQKEPNTKYYNSGYIILTEPNTGNILAMTGKKIINNKIIDITSDIITNSVTVGSTIKAASHITGYNNKAIKIGEIRNDECIKIKSTPSKCSFKYLGSLNDIEALKYSSNTYQFHTAIKIGEGHYKYNRPLNLNKEAFKIYRETFNEFGLGIKTEIDLPNEKLGFKGNSVKAGHLLDLSIGQYDTYTPIQLSQYITTIASDGKRYKMNLLDKVIDNNKIIYKNESIILNTVDTEKKFLNRTQIGLHEVLKPYGTGYNYINPIFDPAGKTGTSQSFIDTDNDKKIDTQTISSLFVGYAPFNNPQVTFTIINPNISYINSSNYVSLITKNISKRVSNAYFSIYK